MDMKCLVQSKQFDSYLLPPSGLIEVKNISLDTKRHIMKRIIISCLFRHFLQNTLNIAGDNNVTS